jgi:hypothetical protein
VKDEKTWFNYFLGPKPYRPEEIKHLIWIASFKVAAPLIAFGYCIKSRYVIHQSHLKLLRVVLDYVGTVIKTIVILYVGILSVDYKKVSSFFYMNTFIVLVINIFYKSSNHKDLLKVKVTGYFIFIVVSSSLALWTCTFGIHWVAWKTVNTDPWVAEQKREFIYKSYLVAGDHRRNSRHSCWCCYSAAACTSTSRISRA